MITIRSDCELELARNIVARLARLFGEAYLVSNSWYRVIVVDGEEFEKRNCHNPETNCKQQPPSLTHCRPALSCYASLFSLYAEATN
jgi:hypothetical protein